MGSVIDKRDCYSWYFLDASVTFLIAMLGLVVSPLLFILLVFQILGMVYGKGKECYLNPPTDSDSDTTLDKPPS